MSEINRVPVCPDCGEPGIKVKGDYFRCPECKATWEEHGWDILVAKEQVMIEETNKLRNISSLLIVNEETCDECGKLMKHAEKYCYDANISIKDNSSGIQPRRGKRYCAKCSLRAGYLRMVRDTTTGKEYPAMFRLKYEEYVD